MADLSKLLENNKEEKQRNPMTFSIDEIGFSVRTNNCLGRHGVKTIGELCNMTESEVAKIRNLGFNCLVEIKTKLAEYGLKLAKLESIEEGWTPIDDAPISNKEKERIVEKQNSLQKNLKSADGKMVRLEQKLEEVKTMFNSIKEEDCTKWVVDAEQKITNTIEENARITLNNALMQMRTESWKLKNEIESREKKLETLDPTSKYYSAVVGCVLDAVKSRGFELTSQNATDIVCKVLEVAGYQKWQEIKGENWGRNETNKPMNKRII